MLRLSFSSHSQWTSRRLENWFQNSLKQLSAVQQKQVGLLLGIAVADAAAHSWQGYTQVEMNSWIQQQQQNVSCSSEKCARSSLPFYADYARGSLDPNPYHYGLSNSSSLRFNDFHRRDIPDIPFSVHQLRSSSYNTHKYCPLESSKGSSSSFSLAFASPPSKWKSKTPERVDTDTDVVPRSMATDNAMNLIDFSHSFTYTFFSLVVHFMSRSRGNFFQWVPEVQASWVQEAKVAVSSGHSTSLENNKTTLFIQEHKTLLHSLFAVLGLPVLYPYTSDEALCASSQSLLNFLLEMEDDEEHLYTSKPKNSVLRRSCAWVVLSVLMRCLQSNPDPLRNSALLVAVPSQQAPFRPVEEIRKACSLHLSSNNTSSERRTPSVSQERTLSGSYQRDADKKAQERELTQIKMLASLQSMFPDNIQKSCFGFVLENQENGRMEDRLNDEVSSLASTNKEIQVIREALTIASQFSTHASSAHPMDAFARGVEAAIALGSDYKNDETIGTPCSLDSCSSSSLLEETSRRSVVTHRAALVGAFLGAKFGVRAIPLHWLSATVDHSLLISNAIDIAQYSWNPEPLNYE